VQVSILLVRALISAVERAGASRDAFLALARIDPDDIALGQARLSVEDYTRAMEAALVVSHDPALGLHLGERAIPAMYHVVAHLVEHASTLGDGIEMILRYSSLLAAGFEPCLVEQGEYVALRLPYLTGEHPAVRLTAEFGMVGLMRMLRQFVGERVRPLRVCFAYAAPAHAQEYRRVFDGLECFGQPFTELVFPRAWLERAQLHADPELRNLLQSHADRELAQLERGGTIGERVQRVLASCDPRILPNMQDVARDLDISARTLARKLQLEGTSFVELVEQRRGSAAKGLLERRRLSIQEVADAMGFADAPAFHKAFRRWTGLTPKQYVATVFR
jgi:AraC-like DNA-binding protein